VQRSEAVDLLGLQLLGRAEAARRRQWSSLAAQHLLR